MLRFLPWVMLAEWLLGMGCQPNPDPEPEFPLPQGEAYLQIHFSSLGAHRMAKAPSRQADLASIAFYRLRVETARGVQVFEDIAPSTTLRLAVPAGRVRVRVEALNRERVVMATGEGEVQVRPGEVATLAIQLHWSTGGVSLEVRPPNSLLSFSGALREEEVALYTVFLRPSVYRFILDAEPNTVDFDLFIFPSNGVLGDPLAEGVSLAADERVLFEPSQEGFYLLVVVAYRGSGRFTLTGTPL